MKNIFKKIGIQFVVMTFTLFFLFLFGTKTVQANVSLNLMVANPSGNGWTLDENDLSGFTFLKANEFIYGIDWTFDHSISGGFEIVLEGPIWAGLDHWRRNQLYQAYPTGLVTGNSSWDLYRCESYQQWCKLKDEYGFWKIPSNHYIKIAHLSANMTYTNQDWLLEQNDTKYYILEKSDL